MARHPLTMSCRTPALTVRYSVGLRGSCCCCRGWLFGGRHVNRRDSPGTQQMVLPTAVRLVHHARLSQNRVVVPRHRNQRRGVVTPLAPQKYRTIVADPPWDHSDGTGFSYGEAWNPVASNQGRARFGVPHSTGVPYGFMSVREIAGLPVDTLAETNAHLYLWTTQRYLHESFHVVEQWGFTVSATLTWCKAPKGFMGGAFRSSTEFCHFAKRGSLGHKIQAPTRWFTWPRVGWTQSDPVATHSRKPDAFLDLVEQVSPGPYLEMFARRQRLGWDTWGNEALGHVDLDYTAARGAVLLADGECLPEESLRRLRGGDLE